MNKGMLIIISGPSGSGKGTVVKRICPRNGIGENQQCSQDFAVSISVTTRKKREGEVDGRDYFFCTEEEFYNKLRNNELLESATFVGNYYGTPRSYVKEQIEKGKTVVLEIEVNGALQVKDKFPDSVLVFLIPPSIKELKSRLVNRNTEDMETIEDRLRRAEEELKLVDKYDYLIVNENVDDAVNDIKLIVKAEKMKPSRRKLKEVFDMSDCRESADKCN
jgi:guanylate kinase